MVLLSILNKTETMRYSFHFNTFLYA